MELTIPTALKSLSAAGSAIKDLTAWWKKAKGDSRAVIGELKDNLSYLDMVAEDGVDLSEVIDTISVSEYKRLAKEGFNFNTLKKGKISLLPSLEGTDLSSWNGKETAELIESIYDKINDLKIRHPYVKKNEKYRWSVRVNNIRKRIWLLLKHVRS
ncbi:MAG: hypothetical protein COC05_07015 [Gammaproteobacteria bacterium]|nr:MAG: hypothetical protein COC05_07015 [Gammaproteobacteria bacterium]